MIPKIIHYCWFGGNPLPELAQKCIESWRKYCPDYEIRRWDESNFDVNYNDYVREAYEAKKWAFVSDVVRLYALVNYGGIYMDTDVEVIKPLDDLLHHEAVSGFESKSRIPTGLMSCREGQALFTELLHDYDGIHFKRSDGTFDTTTNVKRITNKCLKYGLVLNNSLQTICGLTLYPSEYFCPKDLTTRVINLTKNTLTIHHFDGSWQSEDERYRKKLKEKLNQYIPGEIANHLANFIGEVHINGFKQAFYKTFKWILRKKDNKIISNSTKVKKGV